jgi:hypothetical protein
MTQVNVEANKHWFHTGISLIAGTAYKFTATGRWSDENIICGPDGYNLLKEVPEWQWPTFRLVEPLRPMNTGDTWFQLVGKVADTIFLIADGVTYTPGQGGELLCCANDCPFMFWNNTGSLTLAVEQL